MREEFLSCYNKVFDKDGKIKRCGRDRYKELILLAEKICPVPGKFGSKETGSMNVYEIKRIKNIITKTF